jgi:hypothetical protein
MNILRLVVADKERKNRSPNPEFQKLEAEASKKDTGECPVKFDREELRKRLSPVEYFVTQERGTERYGMSAYVTAADLQKHVM